MGATALYKLSKGININKAYKQIETLIEQHGKVTVIFADPYYGGENKYNLRMRTLTMSGDSRVAYKGPEYDKYSNLHTSCFLGGSSAHGYKKTLQLMREHDGKRIVPVAIWYGPFDVNKITLAKQWKYVNETTLIKNLWYSFLRMWFN